MVLAVSYNPSGIDINTVDIDSVTSIDKGGKELQITLLHHHAQKQP